MSSTTRKRGQRGAIGVTAVGALVLSTFAGAAGAQEDDQELPFDRGTEAVCDGDETHTFPDLAGNTHEANVACMSSYGLTEGRDDGSYGPSVDVRRDQMASFIVRFVEDATGEALPAGDPDAFEDADRFVQPHRDNIAKLVEADIAEGDLEGNFNPLDPVQRQQMATFIRRALSFVDDGNARPATTPPAYVGEPIFADDDPFVTSHRENINALAQAGIVQGDRQQNYRPTDEVGRDQMASFVMRAYDYAVAEELVGEPGEDPGDGESEPTDTTVSDARVALDIFDEQGDTATASAGDVWELTFTEELDSVVGEDDTGVTFTVEDEDGVAFTVQCVVGAEAPAEGNLAAGCHVEDETLFLSLFEDLAVDDETVAAYPLELTATDLVAASSEPFDLEAEGADTTIDVDEDTEFEDLDLGESVVPEASSS